MADLKDWSKDAANNNAAPPDGAPEGWVGDDVNNWGRETMAAVRRWFDNPEWLQGILFDLPPRGTKTINRDSDTQFTVVGVDATLYFAASRLLRITGASSNLAYVASATFTAGNTEVTVEDGTVPAAPLTNVEFYFATQAAQLRALMRYATASEAERTMSAALVLANTIEMQGKEVGGTLRSLARILGTDVMQFGDVASVVDVLATTLNLKPSGDLQFKGVSFPTALAGQAGKALLVNATEDGWEYGLQRYESPTPIAIANRVVEAHGLGGYPFGYRVVFRNVIAEGGFGPGDEIDVTNDSNQGSQNVMQNFVTTWANGVDVGFSFASGDGIYFSNANGTGSFIASGPSWRVVFRAWR